MAFISSMADNELASKLARRQQKNGEEEATMDGNGEERSSDAENAEATVAASGADCELLQRLNRRQNIIQGKEPQCCVTVHHNIYTEFQEFSRKQIKDFTAIFKKYDVNRDQYIDFEELKLMMEKLGEPQTHLALKAMIREVDEDRDNMINLREFLLIFRKAAAGELAIDSGLSALANLTSVDVTKEGVGGAKNFFEAKIDALSRSNKFEEEIRQEQEEKRLEAQQKRESREKFRANKAVFLQ